MKPAVGGSSFPVLSHELKERTNSPIQWCKIRYNYIHYTSIRRGDKRNVDLCIFSNIVTSFCFATDISHNIAALFRLKKTFQENE